MYSNIQLSYKILLNTSITLHSFKLTSALRSLLFPTSSLIASGHPLHSDHISVTIATPNITIYHIVGYYCEVQIFVMM